MTKKVVFTITEKGEMTIDSNGFTGNDCLEELAKFQKFMNDEYGIKMNITDQKKKLAVYASSSQVKGSEVVR